MNRTFYEIACRLLDEQWRAVFVQQLGTQTGPTAFVFAASRTDDILGR